MGVSFADLNVSSVYKFLTSIPSAHVMLTIETSIFQTVDTDVRFKFREDKCLCLVLTSIQSKLSYQKSFHHLRKRKKISSWFDVKNMNLRFVGLSRQLLINVCNLKLVCAHVLLFDKKIRLTFPDLPCTCIEMKNVKLT